MFGSGTPEQVLKSIVDGIHAGNLDAFIGMKGTLDLKVTRVLEATDLGLVVGVWSFKGTVLRGYNLHDVGRLAPCTVARQV
jgi:hypothetical protein